MILRVLVLLLLATPAWAGSFTVTTTAEQDAALAAKAAQQGITPDALVRGHVLNGLANPAIAESHAARARRYREKLDALDPVTRAKVLQNLGLTE